MSPWHLLLKVILGLLILLTVAVHGVCRVPRMIGIFVGFPLAMFLFLSGTGVLLTSVVAGLSALNGGVWGSNGEDEVLLVLGTLVTVCAMPVLIYYAAINPLLTWLIQTTPFGPLLTSDGSWSILNRPFHLFMTGIGSSGNVTQSTFFGLTLQQIASALDALWAIPTQSPVNWAFLFGLQLLLMRDALARGTDQFEFFRVRGYPERLAELRWLERQRLRTRNQRTLSAQLRPIGLLIEQRLPGVRHPVALVVALAARPFAPRMAYRALTLDPLDLEKYYAARRQQFRVADQRRQPAGKPGAVVAAGPAGAATASPAASGAIDPVVAVAAAPEAAPMPVAPPSQVTRTSEELLAQRTQRKRPPPKAVQWVGRFIGQVVSYILQRLNALVPPAVRANPYYQRDWRAMQKVLRGEQEGQWAYSWTVLLIVNLCISSFILFIVCFFQGLGMLIQASFNSYLFGQSQTIDLSWPQAMGWNWLQWMASSCPVAFFAVPIYAWLKERKRPDWDVLLLNPQMGAGWLAAKWGFFMQQAMIGIVLLVLLLHVLNPLLWLGWLVPYFVAPVQVQLGGLMLEPLSTLAFLLLLLGYLAWSYQTIQALYFAGLCLPLAQSRMKTSNVLWILLGIGVALWILNEIASTSYPEAMLEARLRALQPILDWLAKHISEPIGSLIWFIAQFFIETLPVFPWLLWSWYWGEESGGSFNWSDWQVAAQPVEQIALTFGLYVSFALINYRISLHLFETRLRGLDPRTFSLRLGRRRLRRQQSVV